MGRPRHCLNLMCRRLRDRCSTVASLLAEGPKVTQALCDSAFAAMDFCERSHAQARCDLRTSGPARSFSTTASRFFCHQLRAAHVGTAGMQDPMSGSLVTLVEGMGGGSPSSNSPQALAPALMPRSSAHVGGSGRLLWQNSRMSASKRSLLHRARVLGRPGFRPQAVMIGCASSDSGILRCFFFRTAVKLATNIFRHIQEYTTNMWDRVWGGSRRFHQRKG